MSDSLNPDLNGTICSATGCLNVADVISLATLRTNVLVGAVPDEELITVAIPLCVTPHAHLLRMEPTLVSFDDRLR